MNHKPKGIYEKVIKRVFDFVLSLLALIILSPLLLITVILVRFKLGSPVIFKQERPGKDEKTFKLYKFRTMTNEKDENGELFSDEIRLTKFGKFLRTTSIDELPELINILKGDMSIIGPRPLLVQYLPLYNVEQKRRHEVRPGLTGLAQAYGRNSNTWEKKFKLDVEYVDNITFLQDLKIFFKTISAVLKKDGISAEGSATMEAFSGTTNSNRGEKMVLGIYGAGGLGREMYELASIINETKHKWDKIVFIDDNKNGELVRNLINIYSFEKAADLFGKEIEFIIGIGEPRVRELIYNKIKENSYSLTTLIHPNVYIADTTVIGEGTIVCSGVYISCDVKIGNNVLMQPFSSVGHDCIIGNNVVCSTFTNMAGNCKLGNNSYIGLSVCIKESITIGTYSIVGMGSVVVRDIEDEVVALGNPARAMRKNEEHKVFGK